MAVRKRIKDDGTSQYLVHFGEYYLGSFISMMNIVNDWLNLIVRRTDKEYTERLEEFNDLLQSSLTIKSNFIDGSDKGTFLIFNLIWFFCYQKRGTPKNYIGKFIDQFDGNGISKILDIFRPQQRPLPELDELLKEHGFTEIGIELGKPLAPVEIRQYRKNLKQFKQFMEIYEEMIIVIHMELQALNLKFEPTQFSKIESELEELKNEIRILKTENKNLNLKMNGEKPDHEMIPTEVK